mmetsp:Transcript_21309/g.30845  ORF Transcript_21309/g.30845 Transcript_21309/m.30845 type:complete len:207 (-) Transcript_21309:2022-2642(-)
MFTTLARLSSRTYCIALVSSISSEASSIAVRCFFLSFLSSSSKKGSSFLSSAPSQPSISVSSGLRRSSNFSSAAFTAFIMVSGDIMAARRPICSGTYDTAKATVADITIKKTQATATPTLTGYKNTAILVPHIAPASRPPAICFASSFSFTMSLLRESYVYTGITNGDKKTIVSGSITINLAPIFAAQRNTNVKKNTLNGKAGFSG